MTRAPVTRLLAHAAFPAALVPLPDGCLLYGEHLTGRIRLVDARGRLRSRPLTAVAVSTGGQRGLLGLARDHRGHVFAAWTERGAGRRIVVGQVTPTSVAGPRIVWRGPPSATLADGGHLAFARDGRLLIGIGDLQEPPLTTAPSAPNGKLLALDPSGPATQRPIVLSAGWNNPFAFTVLPNGQLWVADNAPGKRPERLGRGDLGPDDAVASDTTPLVRKTAPSGLAALSNDTLLVCGVVSHRLDRYVLDAAGHPRAVGGPLADDCAIGVVRLTDGRIAYATERSIRIAAR